VIEEDSSGGSFLPLCVYDSDQRIDHSVFFLVSLFFVIIILDRFFRSIDKANGYVFFGGLDKGNESLRLSTLEIYNYKYIYVPFSIYTFND
jgi:hypothetical protein